MINSPDNQTYFAQYGAVDAIDIVTASGELWPLKALMIELSYYEDIYSFAISGYVTLKDAFGVVERLRLSGHETLYIDFGNGVNDPRPPQKFKLYSIPKRDPLGNLNSEIVKLYFCSEELLLSEQTKVLKAYKGQNISYMINDILENDLVVKGTGSKFKYIQNTIGKYDFNIPTIKPFEAISWLSTYALPSTNGGADMLFFETVYGYFFQSLGDMYKQTATKTYKYAQKDVSNEPDTDEMINVLDFEFVKTFDSLEEIEAGTFANRVISIDPITRTKKVTDFDYSNYKSGASKMNESDVLATSKNKLGKTQNQAYTGKLKLVTSNSGQKSKLTNLPSNAIAEDIFIEKTLPNRTAQIALANYTLLKIRIPGNSLLAAGKTIQFNLVSYSTVEKQKNLDEYYSGKYLVTAIRHIIQGNDTYQCILEIAKESTPKKLPDDSAYSINI